MQKNHQQFVFVSTALLDALVQSVVAAYGGEEFVERKFQAKRLRRSRSLPVSEQLFVEVPVILLEIRKPFGVGARRGINLA